MPSKKQLMVDVIPFEDQLYVDRLRTWVGDTVALNILEQEEESSDTELYHYLQDALDEVNYEFLPSSSYSKFSEVPSWNILKMGAVLQLLSAKGIHASRNTVTYNDGGGVTIQDMDKYGRYINYYNILINKYVRGVTAMKMGENIDKAYGGIGSEYGQTSDSDVIW